MSINEIRLTGQDLFILRRWWLGLPSHPDVQATNPLVTKLVSTLDSRNSAHRQVAEQLFSSHIAAIIATDPDTPPPAAEADSDYIPPLPPEASLTDGALKASEKVATWYKETVTWLTQRSPMTPPQFLEAGAAWLMGLAINRRVCIELHEQIYPNLYVLIVAETSRYAKSTGLKAIGSLVTAAMPHMTIPGSTTTEGMVELLSGHLPVNFDKLTKRDQNMIEAGRRFAGQRGILLDEYSRLLGSVKKDYMHGFVELLMSLYDNNETETYHTRSGGMIVVRYPAISIMGATTPAAMARALTHEMWENGAMARYLVMFRDDPLPFNPEYAPFIPPQTLVKPLIGLHNSLPAIKANDLLESDDTPFTPLFAQITKEAHAAYQAYTKAVFYDMLGPDLDERLHGQYRRLHVQAMKIALALACMDWQQSDKDQQITIKLGHWAIAQELVEKGRAALHRMMPVLSQTHDTRTRKTLLAVLKNYPAGLTLTEIGDKIGRNNNELRSAIDILTDSGQIEVEEVRPPTGRPTVVYKTVVR